jgi:quaternary ammonium compound-resistance protein SugE
MGWLYVGIAGLLEIGWIISLKFTEGFTRPVPIVFYALFGASSAFFLSLSMKHLPMAPAYIIWMGIGMVGAAVYGALFLAEPLNALKIVSMILIVAGVVGIKVASDGDGRTGRKPVAELAAAEAEPEAKGGETDEADGTVLRAAAGD